MRKKQEKHFNEKASLEKWGGFYLVLQYNGTFLFTAFHCGFNDADDINSFLSGDGQRCAFPYAFRYFAVIGKVGTIY